MNSALLALGLRSAILVFAGWVVTMLLRKAPASWRSLVWRLTILGLLLMPIMLLRLPTWDVPAQRVPVVGKAMELVQPQVSPSEQLVELVATATPEARANLPKSQPMDWVHFCECAWGVISTLALLPLLLGMIALSRTIRRSRPLNMPEFSTLCADMGIRKTISLRTSCDIQTPATAGFFKPVVLLPIEAPTWEVERLEMVLRHELGHVQRGDWLVRMLAHAACVLYAPNPVVWVASARLRAESEAACDDLVIAGGVNAKAYAHELLSIARSVRRSSLGIATVGMAHRSNVEFRLRAIVNPRRRRGSASRRTIVSLTACGLVAAGLIASFRLVSAQIAPQKDAAATLNAEMASFMKGIRDDVPDHPNIPSISPGAKYTVSPYEPSADRVTVVQNGTAQLANGVTISLTGIAPTATSSPIWNIANRPVQNVKVSLVGPYFGDGQYHEGLDRSLYCSITSSSPTIASTMGYLVRPHPPELYKEKGAIYGSYGKDSPSNSFSLGPDSSHTIRLWIPGRPKTESVTYRVGVATGAWRSVMDVPNPYHGSEDAALTKSKNIGGGVTLFGIPCIIGPAEPGSKVQPNDRFVGEVNSSDLVARRALVLDANGDLIRGEVSHQVGWYPLSYSDLRRCTHVVIQEREMEWAEFRDVPIRPNLETKAMKAAGALITGTAEGIAPGFLKTIPGLGTVGISAVTKARIQGESWTEDRQPRWRADGKVLAEPSQPPDSGAGGPASGSEPPTDIRVQYSGHAWHGANVRLRIAGEPTDNLPIWADLPPRIARRLDKNAKEVTVLLDIADGPWTTLYSKLIDIKALPDMEPSNKNQTRTGLVLLDGDAVQIIVFKEPTDLAHQSGPLGEMIQKPPKNSAHRFVAVLRDGSSVQIPSGFSVLIPARRGEASYIPSNGFGQHRKFLASDVKEIRYETRPITRTIRFEHVRVKPVL